MVLGAQYQVTLHSRRVGSNSSVAMLLSIAAYYGSKLPEPTLKHDTGLA